MQSSAQDSRPPKLRRYLAKLGGDIAMARRKRNLTTMMMAERIGTAKSTYLKVEKGNPTVSMGVYALKTWVSEDAGPEATIDALMSALPYFRSHHSERRSHGAHSLRGV
jgi:DNA-binding XRE family transcriptional regulator